MYNSEITFFFEKLKNSKKSFLKKVILINLKFKTKAF